MKTHLIVTLPYQLLILGGYTKILYNSSTRTLQAYGRSLSTFACRTASGSVKASSSSSGATAAGREDGEVALDVEKREAVLEGGGLEAAVFNGRVTKT
jgi:hypothetical protein